MLHIVISQMELKQKSPHCNKGHIAKGLVQQGPWPGRVVGRWGLALCFNWDRNRWTQGLKQSLGQGAEPWVGGESVKAYRRPQSSDKRTLKKVDKHIETC